VIPSMVDLGQGNRDAVFAWEGLLYTAVRENFHPE
jgi:hypothetical protein